VEPAEPIPDLVYDVGMHRGEDSAYYLRKGYRVIAFEANPALVEACRARFADEIADGRLTIVSGAIVAEPPEASTVTFHRHTERSGWGTIDVGWAERNALPGRTEAVEVPAVDFRACLQRYGMPHYLKVDIEGADRVCLEALRGFEGRPAYLSLEADRTDIVALGEELAMLEGLGYDRFATVQQKGLAGTELVTTDLRGQSVTHRFEEEASGPFGEDLSAPWRDGAATLRRYRRILVLQRTFGARSVFGRSAAGRRVTQALSKLLRTPLPGWYDTHAKHASAP
jgi:FkbM family methyltransferase